MRVAKQARRSLRLLLIGCPMGPLLVDNWCSCAAHAKLRPGSRSAAAPQVGYLHLTDPQRLQHLAEQLLASDAVEAGAGGDGSSSGGESSASSGAPSLAASAAESEDQG
mgnify:CR=1 FL=1